MNIWKILGIEPTTDKRAIKRAYAAKTKETHPEEKPEEFKRLYEAYQAALAYVDYVRQVEQSGGSVTFFYRTDEDVTKDAGGEASENAEHGSEKTEAVRTEETETTHAAETPEKRNCCPTSGSGRSGSSSMLPTL